MNTDTTTSTSTTATARRRARSLLGLAGATLLLPALLVGCSSTAADTAATGPTGGTSADLAGCMRDKGYDMADSVAGGGGGMQLQVPDGVDAEQYMADFDTCLGDGEGAGEGKQAKPVEGMTDMMQEAAACIREKGFSDYPDDEDGMRTYQPDDAAAFDEAARACNDDAFGDSFDGVGE